MLDVMFELPSRKDIEKCILTKETVADNEPPKLVLQDGTVLDTKHLHNAKGKQQFYNCCFSLCLATFLRGNTKR